MPKIDANNYDKNDANNDATDATLITYHLNTTNALWCDSRGITMYTRMHMITAARCTQDMAWQGKLGME